MIYSFYQYNMSKFIGIKQNLTTLLSSSQLNTDILFSIDKTIKNINIKNDVKVPKMLNYINNSKLYNITEKLYFCDNINIDKTSNYTNTIIIGSFKYNKLEYYYIGKLIKHNFNFNNIDLWFSNSIKTILTNFINQQNLFLLNNWFKVRITGILSGDNYFRIFDEKLDNFVITYDILRFYFDDYKVKCLKYNYDCDDTINDFEDSNDIVF